MRLLLLLPDGVCAVRDCLLSKPTIISYCRVGFGRVWIRVHCAILSGPAAYCNIIYVHNIFAYPTGRERVREWVSKRASFHTRRETARTYTRGGNAPMCTYTIAGSINFSRLSDPARLSHRCDVLCSKHVPGTYYYYYIYNMRKITRVRRFPRAV